MNSMGSRTVSCLWNASSTKIGGEISTVTTMFKSKIQISVLEIGMGILISLYKKVYRLNSNIVVNVY